MRISWVTYTSSSAGPLRKISKRFQWNYMRLSRHPVLLLNPCIDFVSMHFDGLRGLNAELDLSAFRTEHHDPDIGTDRDAFSPSASQHQHVRLP
jgi:hypothetical protein